MDVLDRLDRHVGEDVAARGRARLEDDAVRVLRANAVSADIVVEGNGAERRVNLAWTDRDGPLSSACSCGMPGGDACEHVVAAALLAEREGLLPSPAVRPTMPRHRGGAKWLSATGELRRVGEEEPRPAVRHTPSLPSWKKILGKIADRGAAGAGAAWPEDREVLYIFEPAAVDERGGLVVRLGARDRRSAGGWSVPRGRGIAFPEPAMMKDPADRQIVALLRGAAEPGPFTTAPEPHFRLPSRMQRLMVPLICRTGRAMVRAGDDADEARAISWDEGEPYAFFLEGRRDDELGQFVLSGTLRRGEERIPVYRPAAVTEGGIVFFDGRAAAVDDNGAGSWIRPLRQHRSLLVPLAQAEELLREMLSLPRLPRLDLPEELRVEVARVAPRPRLRIRTAGEAELRPDRLRAELSFDYDGLTVRPGDQEQAMVYEPARRRLVVRDAQAEREAARRLRRLGLRDTADSSRGLPAFWFGRRHLLRVVRTLVQEKWRVEADGAGYREGGRLRLSVSSGVDWFELRGEADFDGGTVGLPELLAALRRGDRVVKLKDGSLGVVPDEWARQLDLVSSIAQEEGDALRFAASQAGLLDAMLASEPEATWDEGFERTRRMLQTFEGIEPADAPAGFIGELRPYQRDGLGWFGFLRDFGYGGCLADDMGLGKTVQVLALLEGRRDLRSAGGNGRPAPSLVVVPKSLVFNWKQEAQRFTPTLRVLDHTGIDRVRGTGHLDDYDLIITTYGTLRRDAAFLKDMVFDYIVLDEAQAVKNPSSESAKAVRLVKGRHRLALSGTPVQNHLGDLWSLFDFLNPGMLGAASVFIGTGAAARNPDAATRNLLSRALRPFILRRTKEQVAADLPPRLEQTLYCELDAEQRRLYDELKDYYRRSLLDHVAKEGLSKSRMQILEALLRLRQAALHPGLIDPQRSGEPGAKLDVLLPQLEEVMEEGHKALVFSQFTSMLAIVRARLDAAGVTYEYLDGKTTDREARVKRFQEDERCRLFLVSLKAGGLGLNLTAADYVFLLDPWWNPAVEQQAIDRAHRIGQTRQVYACRLIAKDTVEEKVLALQQSKRELADAIITADNSLIRALGREELEMLLS